MSRVKVRARGGTCVIYDSSTGMFLFRDRSWRVWQSTSAEALRCTMEEVLPGFQEWGEAHRFLDDAGRHAEMSQDILALYSDVMINPVDADAVLFFDVHAGTGFDEPVCHVASEGLRARVLMRRVDDALHRGDGVVETEPGAYSPEGMEDDVSVDYSMRLTFTVEGLEKFRDSVCERWEVKKDQEALWDSLVREFPCSSSDRAFGPVDRGRFPYGDGGGV